MSETNYDRYYYESIDGLLESLCEQTLKGFDSSRDRAKVSPILEKIAGDIRAGSLELIRDIEDPLWDTHWDEVARRICTERVKTVAPFPQCLDDDRDENTLGDDNYLINCYIPDGALDGLSCYVSGDAGSPIVDMYHSIESAMGNLIQSLSAKIHSC